MILGIDPGMNGGLAGVDLGGYLIAMAVMPTVGKQIDVTRLNAILEEWCPTSAFLEKASARPGQGVSTMFKFGRVFGTIEGVLGTREIPYQLVTPQAWTKRMHAGIEGNLPPKQRSLLAASRLFPGMDLRATSRSTVPHDGIVDAALIAGYGRLLSV